MKLIKINTFASQRFVFEKKSEQFRLENKSNLTHEFLYDNFNKTILATFIVKIITQTLICQI